VQHDPVVPWSIHDPYRATWWVGQPGALRLTGTGTGLPWDVAYTNPQLGVPLGGAGIQTNGGQVVNIDVTAPSLTFILGLGFNLPFAPLNVPLTYANPCQRAMQMVMLNPASAEGFTLSALTELRVIVPSAAVIVEAVGPDSFNSTSVSGFWRISHTGLNPSPIVQVVLDWAGSAIPAQTSRVFDCDQSGMNGVLIYGNGAVPAYGTYRNDSDLDSGLVYDAANTHVGYAIGVVAGGNCGFIASNQVGSTPSHKTLRLRFAPGAFARETFEFDADTDGGLADQGGGGQQGLRVTVTLQNGQILTGFLAPDSADPDRAFVAF
jgi:hypothetical protein